MGRPSSFTQEIADAICERLADGESLRSVCRDEGMPSQSMVFRWIAQSDTFREQYAHAKDAGCELMGEEIIEIADDGSNDWMKSNKPDDEGYSLNGEHVQRSKLRVDARKWYLSKILPKKYGDKVTMDVNVKDDLAARLAAGRKRVRA